MAASHSPAEPPPAEPPPRQLSATDALVQLSFAVLGTLERRAAEHEVSIVQTRLLGVLRDRRPTMQELARLLDLDKSSVSGLVDRAQRRGLVSRVPSTADRRSVRVQLTDRGRRLVATVAADFAQDMTAALDVLPARERDALTEIVSQMLVANASRRGIDLFATDEGSVPEAGSARGRVLAGRRSDQVSRSAGAS